MEVLKVGDYITADKWFTTYVVVLFSPTTNRYTLENTETGQQYGWTFTSTPQGFRINGILYNEYIGGVTSGKTPVEIKIAFMQQRWEKRHG